MAHRRATIAEHARHLGSYRASIHHHMDAARREMLDRHKREEAERNLQRIPAVGEHPPPHEESLPPAA